LIPLRTGTVCLIVNIDSGINYTCLQNPCQDASSIVHETWQVNAMHVEGSCKPGGHHPRTV
jgi:hypothetical protein